MNIRLPFYAIKAKSETIRHIRLPTIVMMKKALNLNLVNARVNPQVMAPAKNIIGW